MSQLPAAPHAAGHFLPVRKAKLLEMLLEDRALDLGPEAHMRRLMQLLESWFHQHFQASQERMKSAFAHFDPEIEARWGPASPEAKQDAALALGLELDALLIQANYERIDFSTLDPNQLRESIQKIALTVDLDDFEQLVIYRRGMTSCWETIPTWFGLRKRRLQVPGFERVCFFLRFKDRAYFEAKKRRRLSFVPGSISLKLFRNIPCVDLGTLFPNAELRMRLVDRLLVGVPAAAGIIHSISYKLLPAALGSLGAAFLFATSLSDEQPDTKNLVAAMVSLGVFGGFLLRKFNQFRNRKIYFLKVLSENLYFRNLDNDAGVFLHLLDAAEEAEIKEVLLAYSFLRVAEAPLLMPQLDQSVERWLASRLGKALDFEVDDALRKLVELELVQLDAGGRYSALGTLESIERLERRWKSLHAQEHS